MNLSDIYDYAGGPRGQPVEDLTDALKALGVEVEFWQNRTPRSSDADADTASYIWGLVWDADRLAKEGNVDAAIADYRKAVEECPRPNLHRELGRILADRAAVGSHLIDEPGSPILSELEINLPLTFRSDGSGDLPPTLPIQPELLDDGLLGHPLGSHSQQLLRLALECYGRAYVGHLADVMAGDMTIAEAEHLFFRQCLVLDGLRVTFLEMAMREEAEIVCHVFEIWSSVIAEQGGEAGRIEFQRRFAQTLGRLYADRSVGSLEERQFVRAKLEREMRGFSLLPRMVREYLTSARIYHDRADKKADYAHVVTELYKATEGTLQSTMGKAAAGGLPLLQTLYEEVRRDAKEKSKKLMFANLPAFKDMMKKVAGSTVARQLVTSWLAPAVEGDPRDYFEKLVTTIENLVERDAARHSSESWKVARQTAEELYVTCVGNANQAGLLEVLLRAQLKSRGDDPQ